MPQVDSNEIPFSGARRRREEHGSRIDEIANDLISRPSERSQRSHYASHSPSRSQQSNDNGISFGRAFVVSILIAFVVFIIFAIYPRSSRENKFSTLPMKPLSEQSNTNEERPQESQEVKNKEAQIEEPVQAANTELPVTEAAPVNMAATLPQNYDDSTTSIKTADTSPIEVLLEVKPKLEPVASAQYMERAARLKGLR
jgi:cytoskeletal protein RodZ